MKTKLLLVSLLFIVHIRSAQECKKKSEVNNTQLEQSQIATPLEKALPVNEIQHLVLAYIDNKWEGDESAKLEHLTYVSSVAISPDGKSLASGSSDYGDRTVKIWHQHNNKWQCVQMLYDHKSNVWDVTFSPNGKYLASGAAYGDNTLKIWQQDDNKQWQCMQTIPNHSGSIEFSPNSEYMASILDNKITLSKEVKKEVNSKWECIQHVNPAHDSAIKSVTFSPNGKYVASSSQYSASCIKIWQLHNNQLTCMQTLKDHTDSVNSLAFS
jgi:WD40 repeat protein